MNVAGAEYSRQGRFNIPWLVFVVLALGIGLRTVQFLGGVDLWHDELALVRSVVDRGLGELLGRPLDHFQVAPAGFLVLLKITTECFGTSTLALRLMPWVMSLAALFLFWRVVARFATGWGMVAAVVLFAISPALVWYGASDKPYGSDVTMSLLLAWLSLRHLEQPASVARAVAAGGLGGLAVLTSFPAVPTAALMGAVLAVAWWRREPRASLRPLIIIGIGWTAAAALAGWYAHGQLSPETDQFMREFWADDFPPTDSIPAAVTWILARTWFVFAHSLVFLPPKDPVLIFIAGLPLFPAAVGLVAGVRTRGLPFILLLAPMLAAWGAVLLRVMPFDGRVGIHTAWTVLVFAGIGMATLESGAGKRWWRWLPRGLAVLTALPLLLIVLLAARPPYPDDDEVRPREVLTELAHRFQPGDRVYVYTQGRHDMEFYGRRAGLESWDQGDRHFSEPRGYLREIDRLRGAPRVWFFWVRLDRDEPGWICGYLGTIGHELDRFPPDDTGRTGAVLYDLSDAARLSATSADAFPLPPAEVD